MMNIKVIETDEDRRETHRRKEYRLCDTFKNKRSLAWLSFLFTLGAGVSSFFVEIKSPEVLNTCLWVCASVILVYMGASTIADNRMLGARPRKEKKSV